MQNYFKQYNQRKDFDKTAENTNERVAFTQELQADSHFSRTGEGKLQFVNFLRFPWFTTSIYARTRGELVRLDQWNKWTVVVVLAAS